MTTEDTFQLNCLVLGQSPTHIFSVEIPKTNNVYVFKKAIKAEKQNMFRYVDADDLDLWKVSLIFDDKVEECLRTFNIKGPALLPLLTMHDVFSDVPLLRHIHIIIKGPSPGERNPHFAFEVC